MPSENHYVGLDLADGKMRVVEIRHSSKGRVLSHLDEIKTDINFESEDFCSNLKNQDFVDRFAGQISTYFSQSNITSKEISVALSSSQAFITELPLDSRLSKSEISEHLQWEISNYYPDLPAESFVIGTWFLRELNMAKEMLIVAVQREIVDFLKSVFAECGCRLRILDIDHFAAEHALKENYLDLAQMDVALFGLKSRHLDVSVISKGEFLYYHRALFGPGTEAQYFIIREIATIQEKLSYVGLDKVFLYGNDVNSELCDSSSEMLRVPFEPVNPFRNLVIAQPLEASYAIKKYFWAFAPSTGLALRTK
jgi:Tfp pilus assembly PilM family ATPase